jgi:hypothetical protein
MMWRLRFLRATVRFWIKDYIWAVIVLAAIGATFQTDPPFDFALWALGTLKTALGILLVLILIIFPWKRKN